MMVSRSRRRTIVCIVLMLLAGAWAGEGYCPMTLALAAAREEPDSHDCCRTGLTGKAPACCHADATSNTLATLKSAPASTPPALSVFTWNLVAPTLDFALRVTTDRPTPAHGPPAAVLRI